MKKLRLLVWAGIVLMCFGVCAGLIDPDRRLIGLLKREPFFRDKPASYWIKKFKSGDLYLSGWSHSVCITNDPPVWLRGPAWTHQILKSVGVSTTWQKETVIPTVEPEAAEAQQELVRLFIAWLDDGDSKVRAFAAHCLGNYDRGSDEAASALVKALGADAAHEVRFDAACALGRIMPKDTIAVPALIEALQDEDAGVRQSAAASLGQFGLQANLVIPALALALEDRATDVRSAAASALARIGAVPTLAAVLSNSGSVEARCAAVQSLIAASGDDTPSVLSALRMALEDKDVRVRREASSVLGLVKLNEDFLPVLTKLLRDPIRTTRQAAIEALGELGAAATTAVPGLIVTLEGSDTKLGTSAAYALGKIGPGAKAAVPALIAAMGDDEQNLRQCAAMRALIYIGRESVPGVIRALAHDNPVVRRGAALVLGQIEPKPKNAVPALRKALDDSDKSVRENAARSLKQLDRE
jgi:HEAT repeat protein